MSTARVAMTVPEQLPRKNPSLSLRFSRTTGEFSDEQPVPLTIPSGTLGLPSASHGLLAGGVGEAGDEAADPLPPPPQPPSTLAATARHTVAQTTAAGGVMARAAEPCLTCRPVSIVSLPDESSPGRGRLQRSPRQARPACAIAAPARLRGACRPAPPPRTLVA